MPSSHVRELCQDLPSQSTPSKETPHVQEISLEATLKEKQPSEVHARPARERERRSGRLVCKNHAMHGVSWSRSLTCRNILPPVRATDGSFNCSALRELQLARPDALNRQLSVDMASSHPCGLRKPWPSMELGQHRT